MKKLYRYTMGCGRMGEVTGLFVADDVLEIKPAIGLDLYFGEILGKHSEVQGTLEAKELVVVSDDQSFITKFEEYGCGNGHSPLDAIKCPECSDVLPAPYKACADKRCGWKRKR